MTDLFPHHVTRKLQSEDLKIQRFIIILPIHLLTLHNNKKLLVILTFCAQFVSMSDVCRTCKPSLGYRSELIPFKIQEAAKKGHTECMEVLLEIHYILSSSPNARHTTLVKALMIAAENGHMNITETLIEAGADVNQVDKLGNTALIVAARKGYLNITETLIEAGADVNLVSTSGITALMVAAWNEHFSTTKFLIEAGADVNKICASLNQTVLVQFALKDNVQGVRPLLQSGAKVNIDRKIIVTQEADIRLLLDAAGQTVMPRLLKSSTDTLHHHCRMVIRKHLLKLDLHENLFLRIPRLGLPSRLAKYLLFDTSLDENDWDRCESSPSHGQPLDTSFWFKCRKLRCHDFSALAD